MKILVILPGSLPFPPVNGGATENLVKYYIQANEKRDSKIYFTVISKYSSECQKFINSYTKTKLLYVNTEKKRFKINRIFRFLIRKVFGSGIANAYIKEIIKILKNEKFDKVLIENAPEYGKFFKKMYPNAQIILHLHNDCINKENKNSEKILHSYDKVLAVSDYVKNRVIEVKPDMCIETLYNTLDFRQFYLKNKEELYKKYNIMINKKTIMYVGRIQPEKGVFELINAFVRCNKKYYGNLQLIIVGGTFFKGSKKDKFSRKIDKLILDNNQSIVGTGFVEYENIPEIISLADVGVVPSKCNEAFGLTLLEFMTVGIPTIITNDGGLIEVGNNTTSIIIDKNKDITNQIEEAIEKLINNRRVM